MKQVGGLQGLTGQRARQGDVRQLLRQGDADRGVGRVQLLTARTEAPAAAALVHAAADSPLQPERAPRPVMPKVQA